jgi:hypothetical protein
MALPAAGQPISFKDINDELGNSSQATLDLKSASEDLGESAAPFGMDELAGLSAVATTWSNVPVDFNLHVFGATTGANDSGVSNALQIDLADADGNTTINCQQPSNGNIELKVSVSTSGDPGTNGTGNSASGFQNNAPGLAAATRYFLRFQLKEVKNNSGNLETAEDRTITFTNNGISNTDLQINIKLTTLLGGLCIHESMLVDTPNGLISIDELNIGDLVKSYNLESDIIEDVPVQEIIKPIHENLYKVNDLILTEDHPIFDENKKLLSISPELSKNRYSLDTNKLEVGHKIKTLNNEELVVNNITRYDGKHKTYTILTKNNNFYVEGILVHSEI